MSFSYFFTPKREQFLTSICSLILLALLSVLNVSIVYLIIIFFYVNTQNLQKVFLMHVDSKWPHHKTMV